jgi:excinuclease UvrABC helicase subunit UvrB
MTTYQKIENLEKRMYKEIKNGNFDKADKIRKKIVDLDASTLAKVLAYSKKV